MRTPGRRQKLSAFQQKPAGDQQLDATEEVRPKSEHPTSCWKRLDSDSTEELTKSPGSTTEGVCDGPTGEGTPAGHGGGRRDGRDGLRWKQRGEEGQSWVQGKVGAKGKSSAGIVEL